MSNLKKIFCLSFFIGCSQFSDAADRDVFQGRAKNVTLNKTFTVDDSSAVPDTWLELTTVSMNTTQHINITDGADPCGVYFCTGGEIALGYSGKASYIVYLTRTPVTITDDLGNTYTFSVAFPNSLPSVYAGDMNTGHGRYWHTALSMSGGNFSLPSSSQDVLSSPVTSAPGNNCGSLTGCLWRTAIYLHSNTGSPVIYMKLPKNLSSKTITFSEQPLLTLKGYLDNKNTSTSAISLPSVSLKISGTITIPERCYLSVDNNSFNFPLVYSNRNNGTLGTVTANVTTTCNYAPDGTKQYIKMTAVSGGSLNTNSNYYEIGNESSKNESLGIIYKINGSPDCNSKGDRFDTEQLINTFSYGWNKTAITPFQFSLCKYGMPSRIGEQNVVLKLTSRWVIE